MKKYFNYYSKHFLFVAFALLFLLPSCNDDVLEEVPLDFLAPENAYSTKAGIGQGIAGLHFTFRDHWYFGDQDQGSMWRGVGTDVAFHGEDPNSTRFLTNYVNYLVPTSNMLNSTGTVHICLFKGQMSLLKKLMNLIYLYGQMRQTEMHIRPRLCFSGPMHTASLFPILVMYRL
jgi:hypothetical protein